MAVPNVLGIEVFGWEKSHSETIAVGGALCRTRVTNLFHLDGDLDDALDYLWGGARGANSAEQAGLMAGGAGNVEGGETWTRGKKNR